MARKLPSVSPDLLQDHPVIRGDRLHVTYPIPDDSSYRQVSPFVASMMGYGVYACKSFWTGAETVLSAAIEMGDRQLYLALSTRAPIEQHAEGLLLTYEIDELEAEAPYVNRISRLARTEVSNLNQCYLHNFDLATSCELSACPYYSKHSHLHCGYDRKDGGEVTFEVIAQQLGTDVAEISALFHSGASKIRSTDFGRRQILDPHWDTLTIEGHCSVCGQHSEDTVCASCISELSAEGAELVLRFRRPLKEIIHATSKTFDNFQLQAMVLDVNVATLKNLYLRVGINRRTTPAASRSYSATHPRPGKTFVSANHEYLAVEVLSARNIFGDFSAPVRLRLSKLGEFVGTCGIEHSLTFV